ncbi:hypothetical protein [Streptomyces sp. NPDC004726]
MKPVLVRTVLPTVLVLGVIGSGLTYITTTVGAADRTVPTVTWSKQEGDGPSDDPAADPSKGRASTPLSKLLLPVPDDYRLGPDLEEYGNDSELTGRQAADLIKESGRGAPGKKRREFERNVDALGVRGIAMRSFASADNDLVAKMEIIQMKDRKHVRKMYGLVNEMFTFMDMPKGPKIEDHKQSSCYLQPSDDADDSDASDVDEPELNRMVCAAYDSELFLMFTAVGTQFDESAAADLLKRQLDHIASPGEYV